MIPAPVTWLTPDAAVVLLTVGVLLIYVELNRPGSVLPGAIGLLACLLAVAALLPRRPDPAGMTLLFTGALLLLLDLLRPTPAIIATAATLAVILGLKGLLQHACCGRISPTIAIGCGFGIGAGTSILTRIARRARVNKGLD